MSKIGALLLLLSLAACGTSSIAPTSARLETGANAGSYLIVGLAETQYKNQVGRVTNSISLALTGPSSTVSVTRFGCGNPIGFYGSAPCELDKIDRQVLSVTAGEWRPGTVLEILKLILADKRLADTFPLYRPITVRPGEIVYLGDFTFTSDFDAQEIRLVSHTRDDDGARVALGRYPAMFAAPIRYADPVQKP